MEIEEFVYTALCEIERGVLRANQKLTAQQQPMGKVPFLIKSGDQSTKSGIDFDIALTVIESRDVKGHVKASISVMGVDAEGNCAKSSQSVSRVRFTIFADSNIGYSSDS